MSVDAMGLTWVWTRGRLFEQVRLISERERESARLIDDFGKWEANEGERELWELRGDSIKWN